jgi:hypothetical protein
VSTGVQQLTSSSGLSIARHATALALCAALTLLFTWPLPSILTAGILGAGTGDNVGALWNIWWARTAISGPDTLFWTPALFAPMGTSLVLHSLAPLASLAAAALPLEVLTAYNVALLASVFLNLACGYWLAWAMTRDWASSCFAGVSFGGAPFLLVRLHGHLNVLSAWCLPLLMLATIRFHGSPNAARAVVLAAAIAAVAYLDAYYAVFGVAMVSVYLAISRWPMTVRRRALTGRRRALLRATAALATIVAAMIVWIAVTGGTDTTIVGVKVRMTDSFNPRVILGFLLVIGAAVWLRPTVTIAPRNTIASSSSLLMLPLAVVVAFILTTPLWRASIDVWRSGDYESQVYFWRSAPPGADLAALTLGNPLGAMTGRWTSAMFDRLSIDRTESAIWVGVAPLVLLIIGIRRLRARRELRPYYWILAIFFVWSLGPYLRLFGANSGFMLPQTFLRFVPIVANARIPGRAFVVVQLMLALCGAVTLASFRDSKRYAAIAFVAILAVTIDYWPVPHPWTPLNPRGVSERLKTEPPGIVLELPLGYRDGFGARGALDHRVLFDQTIHGHPLMGGFVARLSGRIKHAYENDPVIARFLDLSSGSTSAIDPGPCHLTCDVRYVVIDDAIASRELQEFAEKAFTLSVLTRSGQKTLYAATARR